MISELKRIIEEEKGMNPRWLKVYEEDVVGLDIETGEEGVKLTTGVRDREKTYETLTELAEEYGKERGERYYAIWPVSNSSIASEVKEIRKLKKEVSESSSV